MKKTILTLLLGALMLSGCGGNSAPASQAEDNEDSVITEQSTETMEENIGETGNLDDLIEKTYGGFVSTETCYDTFVLKNNSNQNVRVNVDITGFDSQNAELATESCSFPFLGADETLAYSHCFSGIKEVDHVEYNFSYEVNTDYAPVMKDIKCDWLRIDENHLLVIARNEGELPGTEIRATAFFYDENDNFIYALNDYIGDLDGEIKPGAAVTYQFASYEHFDHAEVYLYGGCDLSNPHQEWGISEKDLQVTEYRYQNETYLTEEALAIKNNFDKHAQIRVDMVAYDSKGNVIGGGSDNTNKYDCLAPGQEAVLYARLMCVNVDHIDLFYSFRTCENGISDLENIEYTYEIDGQDVIITATNNGTESLKNMYCQILYFDLAGKFFNIRRAYFNSEGGDLLPGETRSCVVADYPYAFSDVLVYIE
ncbi:hypothetical protein SAMN02910368_02020 [Lachnospiraceae bacterium G11]|nr:hypothetical protein SAMN02910368_02020 [Lachnospiraceae bacterium G11]